MSITYGRSHTSRYKMCKEPYHEDPTRQTCAHTGQTDQLDQIDQIDQIDPNLPLWYAAHDLYSTDPTQEKRTTSCRLHGSHPVDIHIRNNKPCLADHVVRIDYLSELWTCAQSRAVSHKLYPASMTQVVQIVPIRDLSGPQALDREWELICLVCRSLTGWLTVVLVPGR